MSRIRDRVEHPEVPPALRRRFLRLVAALNRLREDVAKIHPEARYYLANDMMHLMSGPSHDDTPGEPERQDRIIESSLLHRSGGGDW